jgi:transcriptional regulator with XRE-family HTH domain
VTPFGARLRQLRESRGVTLTELAAALHVSAAYLSALEHGRRGRPSAGLIHQVNEFFGLIWDEAEDMVRLARLSHPRVLLDTAGLAPEATELANLLAARIRSLSPQALERMRAVLEDEERRRAGE